MKYTNKWIVVPFNSINHQENKSEINKILNNKTLSNDEKLSSYNNFKIREIRKKEINPNKDNVILQNEIQENEQIIESIPDEQNNQIKTLIPKPKKIKKKKTFKEKSFFNVPPAKNTRTQRRIGNETLNQAFNSSIHQKNTKKRKTQQTNDQSDYNQDDTQQNIIKTSQNQIILPSISPNNDSNYETPKGPIKRLYLKPPTLNIQKDPIVHKWIDINDYRKNNSIMEFD